MKAFFLPVGESQRFCVYHDAGEAPRGAVVYVHPFAEEMNLSRRMAALQARALAAAGYAVLQMDLYGCGDSDGDFGDADWQTWVGDIVEATNWLQEQTGRPVDLWGMRTGCLLAVEAARVMRVPPHRFLFWQPVWSGEAYWRQLLRLRLAADVIAGQPEKKVPLPRSGDGQPFEVAGYVISPLLVQGLMAAWLDLPGTGGQVACVEVSAAGETISSALADQIESWHMAGWHVRSAAVKGDFFWQIPEVDDSFAVLAATAELLSDA